MLVVLLVLILIAIVFHKELKAGCGLFILYGIGLALWDYWWGKIIVIIFSVLLLIGTILQIYEKICKWRGVRPFYEEEPPTEN